MTRKPRKGDLRSKNRKKFPGGAYPRTLLARSLHRHSFRISVSIYPKSMPAQHKLGMPKKYCLTLQYQYHVEQINTEIGREQK